MHEVVVDRRALLAVLVALLLREHAPQPLLGTQPPHPTLRGLKPEVGEFVGNESIPEHWVVAMHIDCRVGQLRIIPVAG